MSARDDGLKKELTETEIKVQKLPDRLGELQEFQYADSGMQRNIQLTQHLTYATSGAIGGLETLGYVTY